MFIPVRTYSWLFMFVKWNISSSNPYWNYNLEQNWNIHEYSSLFKFLEFQESRVCSMFLKIHPSSLIWRIGHCDSFKYFSPSKFKLFLCEPVCETYKHLHDNNIWNRGIEFYVKIIRKTLIALKPKAPFPWAWHLKDRFNSDSCKNGRDIFCID